MSSERHALIEVAGRQAHGSNQGGVGLIEVLRRQFESRAEMGHIQSKIELVQITTEKSEPKEKPW